MSLDRTQAIRLLKLGYRIVNRDISSYTLPLSVIEMRDGLVQTVEGEIINPDEAPAEGTYMDSDQPWQWSS